ncbi:3-oxoacyl-ACP reductase FabG [Actinoalloteichus sp. AHMU CJ021]|uniref:3-oxoacyl-[acyl-carrier protein] reductase n=2 Tax=Actinoalloteichus cyanogriseus TaxID=2893586 RepID=A0ABT1JEX8_ACTCY|nr:3-oxoacyl-ACP reductase FabG [Actinoalloteichus caeruleus]AUS77241.1 3-oxoacyl-ACP reductase FabG [Actinoalloteichus sp. AHMU CJ021]MCP2331057.1 3-oxoacyl-[acyl-carrier protein] reductase [Actinoalloteichus caeruleus DSM 43889]
MRGFTDTAAIVTGAAQGIGAATARRLAAEGAAVAVVDLNADRAAEVAADIERTGGRALALGCDVTDPDSVQTTTDHVVAEFGRLDILVNNAGITRDDLLFKMTLPDWNAVLTTNLTSMFLCTQAAQAHMVQARSGRIVNLSSRSALGNRGQSNYAAAKAGVQGLTATLALELGPFGIRVNAVAPGYVATDMTAATARRVGFEPEKHQERAAEQIPLRRVATPEEIASTITFLASDDASYVTGQTLYVNGGSR